MSRTVIKVENVSKQYRLGQVGTGTLSHDLNRWWHRLRGKEDPYLQIGEMNDRTQKGESEYVWALEDISFDVKEGEVLGIIGRNGAGKSTLLKILSRTTAPTTGKVKMKGRVASLLEVGTGFHPELSGRENIFLNGAILGMTKGEIARKFDEIVDFAGVERYIDTPVKRYSSGMYVRLAFAVAAFLEPEILIVDEVLAVGDAEFQKKCIGRMKDVSVNQGRTVLFVSHNMGAIASLCNKTMVIENGNVGFKGSTAKGIDYYLDSGNLLNNAQFQNEYPKNTDILSIEILDRNDRVCSSFPFSDEIKMRFLVRIEERYKRAFIGFRVKDQKERNVFTSEICLVSLFTKPGVYNVQATIPSNTLVPNKYSLIAGLHIPNVELINLIEEELMFSIEETGTEFFQYAGNDYGCVFVDCKWSKA